MTIICYGLFIVIYVGFEQYGGKCFSVYDYKGVLVLTREFAKYIRFIVYFEHCLNAILNPDIYSYKKAMINSCHIFWRPKMDEIAAISVKSPRRRFHCSGGFLNIFLFCATYSIRMPRFSIVIVCKTSAHCSILDA